MGEEPSSYRKKAKDRKHGLHKGDQAKKKARGLEKLIRPSCLWYLIHSYNIKGKGESEGNLELSRFMRGKFGGGE